MTTDEHLLASVLDLLPFGLWIARVPGGEEVLANRVFQEIMGTPARGDVAVGGYARPYGICTRDGAPYPEDRMPFVRAIEARTTVTIDDIVIHRPDGGRVAVRAHARPIFEGDTITHVVIAFADITAEVEAERARHDSEERLRHAQRLEAIGNLAAGVAHDFNNVMASIRMLASLLRLRETDPARADDLRRIEEATERAAALTRSLLAFGRRAPARRARVSVAELARGVVDLVSRTFDRQIEVALDSGDDAAIVDGDAAQLEQLLMNLLVNARDAMPGGGRVVVRVAGGDRVTLEVADSGPGVPPELRSRIFEPYFTTKQLAERPGTGLGLATAYGIVQQHGGAIEVGDAAPHGARFVVTLPAAHPAAAAAAPASGAAPPPGRGRVLLVEDDDAVRRGARGLLELLGYDVVEARDGLEAVEVLRADPARIDAVLLDVVMPRQGGRATLPALRAIRDVPVVVMTGLVATGDDGAEDAADVAAWRALGAHALIAKPFDLARLAAALASATGATGATAATGA